MDRRNFFKIVSTVSAGVATNACGSKTNQLIPLLVSDHEIVPGEEQWHTAVCTECGAGCGTLVRVMAGERVVEREGKQFRERIACVKKIEGNPEDPVSGGRLCARGHAALQGIYNPDRLRGPMVRTGERGKGEFRAVSWEEAIAVVAGKLKAPSETLFLSRPEVSGRSQAIAAFLSAIGAPRACTSSFDGFVAERKAAEIVFGWRALPVYDIARAHYVLSIGADFLGGWVSPVYYARQFGQLRQGRPDVRGRLIHAESRMSLTAASADEWLPVRPGAELELIIAFLHLLLDAKLARHAEALPAAVQEFVESADLPSLIKATGIDEKKLRRVARELGESESPLVLTGTSIVHTNSLDALVAGHYLNLMLGGSVHPGPEIPDTPGNVVQLLQAARTVFLDGENPVYTLGASLGDKDLIVSFSNFIDDSTVYADVIVPDHHSLEWEAAVVSPVTGSVAKGERFVQPLYNTRALAQTLSDIAAKLNLTFAPQEFKPPMTPAAVPSKRGVGSLKGRAAEMAGTVDQFPFAFQPYLSLQYHDGRGANLPWMQELPDPVSSAMWDLPVEIDPKTATKLNIENGDRVRVTSPKSSLEGFAYVHPAALPGVISMAIGQGHNHYGRYASGRGANPLSILAPMWEEGTGVLATGATRVRLERIGEGPGELIQFSPQDRDQGPWGRS